MSEDALVERLAEEAHAMAHWGGKCHDAFCELRGLARDRARSNLLPIVEDYAKAERKAGATRCAWCEMPASGTAQAGDDSRNPSCGEGHGRGFVAWHLDEAERKAERKAGADEALRKFERMIMRLARPEAS